MHDQTRQLRILATMLAISSSLGLQLQAEEPWSFFLPEQRCVDVRHPSELCHVPIPYGQRPATVADAPDERPAQYLSLSDAINISLQNAEVVRVLTGLSATGTGQTIYDVAITNTRIDQQRATFDPNLQLNNGWNRQENPSAFFDPLDPTGSLIGGTRSDVYLHDFGLSKRTLTGGVLDFGVNSNDGRFRPGRFPLNPQTRSSVDLSFTQPLLQGGGATVNRIPILLARIDTERSYFQYKNSIQNHVLSIIEGYWAIVLARTQLWARQKQVEQLRFSYEQAQARYEIDDTTIGVVAQARVAYENFRAGLVTAQANLITREAALRNAMGLSPYGDQQLVPVSPLIDEQLEIDWESTLSVAETLRPDIIELKLILEADQQRLLLSRNQALPRLDAAALYRWNGLEGEMPNGNLVGTRSGEFADWNLGINFSVPLGLRRERALLRQQELIIRRDQANLQQGLHQAVHNLANNLRNLDQFYQQYERYREVRKASRINLDQQIATEEVGNLQFLVVLQAINDWGNAVSNEAQAIVQYNTELARLERESGSILEAHGIAFYEERYGSIGPLGRLADLTCYPLSTRPTPSSQRYGGDQTPSEDQFELVDPIESSRRNDEDSSEPGLIDRPYEPRPIGPIDQLPETSSRRRTKALAASYGASPRTDRPGPNPLRPVNKSVQYP